MTTNAGTSNSMIHMCFYIVGSVSSGSIPRIEIAGSQGKCICSFISCLCDFQAFHGSEVGKGCRGKSEQCRPAGEEGDRKEWTRTSTTRLITLPTAPVLGGSLVPSSPGTSWRPLPSHSEPRDSATYLMLSVNHCAWF